jgi:hypothetical protein
MDYKQFADALHKKISWAYRLEDPNAPPPTIPTLLQVAATFDIGLDVRFRAFSEILDDVATLTPESFAVPSFSKELEMHSFLRVKRRRKVRGSSHRRRPSFAPSHEVERREVIPIGASNTQSDAA